MKAQINPEEHKEYRKLSMDKKNMKRLTGREIHVLKLRFGTQNEKPKSYREIGLILNLSQERIRQIINKAMRKMIHMKKSISGDKPIMHKPMVHKPFSPEKKRWHPIKKIRKWLERKLIKDHLDKFEHTIQLKDEVLDDLVYIIHDRLYKIADEQKDINISLQNMDKNLEKIKVYIYPYQDSPKK